MIDRELLEFILKEINYIRTHTDEVSVLAECNLIETKIKKYMVGEDNETKKKTKKRGEE